EVLATGPWASLLAGQGLADVLMDYPRAWGARLRAADGVARFTPEMVLFLPDSFEAAPGAWDSGARRCIGLARRARPPPRPHSRRERRPSAPGRPPPRPASRAGHA